MKPRNFNKKLTLKKKTIANLTTDDLNKLRGGMTQSDPRACNTNYLCSVYQTILYTCQPGCPRCE